MTTVTFSLFEMNDAADILTVEDVYRRYGAFAGIQAFDFDSALAGFDDTHWTTIANVSYEDRNLARTGTIDVAQIAWYDQDMPHSYSVEFTAHNGMWGAVVRGNGTDTFFKINGWTNALQIQHVTPTLSPILVYRALSADEEITWGRIQIGVYDQQFNSASQGRNIYIIVWRNDTLFAAACYPMATGNAPLKFGMIVPQGDTGVLYTGLRVADLSEVIQYSTLDPGEVPLGAIQRAIEDRYIKMRVRWNGALKAFHPRARANTIQIAATKEFHLTPTVDRRQIFSHIRVLGAFQWVQVMDADLVRDFGHRFRELSNTSLWNTDDCLRVGKDLLVRAKEQAYQARFTTNGLLFSEPEDRISLPNHTSPGQYLDYIIDTISWQYANGTFSTDIGVRRYWYSEP